jgi:hypothetical protein
MSQEAKLLSEAFMTLAFHTSDVFVLVMRCGGDLGQIEILILAQIDFE